MHNLLTNTESGIDEDYDGNPEPFEYSSGQTYDTHDTYHYTDPWSTTLLANGTSTTSDTPYATATGGYSSIYSSGDYMTERSESYDRTYAAPGFVYDYGGVYGDAADRRGFTSFRFDNGYGSLLDVTGAGGYQGVPTDTDAGTPPGIRTTPIVNPEPPSGTAQSNDPLLVKLRDLNDRKAYDKAHGE